MMTENNRFLCKIAELITEIPNAGGIAPRFAEYRYCGSEKPDIIVDPEKYSAERYPACTSEESVAYMESARQFYSALIDFGGIYLHSSAVAMEGRAYLFSGHCGAGKSTHTRLWEQTYSTRAHVFNDDKPALRFDDGVLRAYGTPWCGKDGINKNESFPVGGICFLRQSERNEIRRLEGAEAMQKLLAQTFHKFRRMERLDATLSFIERIVCTVPVYELDNRPERDAAVLSYETMRKGAEESGI